MVIAPAATHLPSLLRRGSKWDRTLVIAARIEILPMAEGQRGLVWAPVFLFHAITHNALRGTGGFLFVQDTDLLC